MNLPEGHLLQQGKYRLTGEVGKGGFGITYKGVWYTDVKGKLGAITTEVPVCIKEYFFKDYCYRNPETFAVEIHSETGRTLFEKFKEKLIKEAKILSEVNHKHIVRVLEVFEENNTAYIAMEYISGCSLKYLLEKEDKLSEPKALAYIHQIGEALQFVHDKNILHLDIKPSNIIIDQAGDARLIDFGVSKRYDVEEQETSTTMLTLSKGFASIEQYDNEGTVSFSPCPDIYSLGATLYNMLTGKIPTESILRATRPLVPPCEINPAISAKTQEAILKAMEIVPGNRFQTVSEFLAALDKPVLDQATKKNEIVEQPVTSDEETTVVKSSWQPPGKPDTALPDEETVIQQPVNASSHRKKKNKILVYSTLISIFAFVISVFAWNNLDLSGKNKEVNGELLFPVNQEDTATGITADRVVQDLAGEEEKEEITRGEEIPADLPGQVETGLPSASLPGVAEETSPDVEAVTQPVPSLTDQYEAFVTTGKDYMESGQYEAARKEFVAAEKIKADPAIQLLIRECDVQINSIQLAALKNQYEEKMSFGRFTIVRKKSTGLYGAIDEQAREMIPCKYLSVGVSDTGRAFEREDGLFDIYNPYGVMIGEGLTNY
ncbi:MAG: serine/threonine protein kinase [Tannerellaceae bacterium]|nr:serine/threonine protein kinase [Tannerellaceae bacterium]